METFFNYDFLLNAFLAALLSSITCGIIGVYIVTRRIVFISGGITHASFGGIGLAYYLGFNPIAGAAGFSVLAALAVEYMTRRLKIRNDSVIAIIWSLGMALGIMLIYLTPGYAPNLLSYLFGNILTVTRAELYFMLILSLIIVVIFVLFYRLILFISFDEEFAKIQNKPSAYISYFMIALVALTIVLNIRIVGIILVLSLLTIPQNIALIFTKKYNTLLLLSIVFALLGTTGGLVSSYYLDIPSGAGIILLLSIMFIVIKTLDSIHLFNQRSN
jgi:zinc transport system permease protein